MSLNAIRSVVISEFSGEINGVKFSDKSTFYSVEYVLYMLQGQNKKNKEIPVDIIVDISDLYTSSVNSEYFTEKSWEDIFENIIQKNKVEFREFEFRPEDDFKKIAEKIKRFLD